MHGATARAYEFYYARPELKRVEAGSKAVPEPAPKARTAPKRKPHHGIGIIVKSGILMFGLALLLVFLCINHAVLNYQILSLEKENSRLETERMRLEYQISQQQSLDRIAELAATELNMVRPGLETSYIVAMAAEPLVMMEESDTGAIAEMEEKRGLSRLYANIVSLAAGNG
ncbi:MAG: hypothetical protein Q4B48_00205 [Syntrophomonadaceae bacterium]|nr:hypothetical protein [Syntrophomonadaceae bacterium]